jgi:hypothetical protein
LEVRCALEAGADTTLEALSLPGVQQHVPDVLDGNLIKRLWILARCRYQDARSLSIAVSAVSGSFRQYRVAA